MSLIDESCTYEMKGDSARRLCIIATDYTINDRKNGPMFDTDLRNIKRLVARLGFESKDIEEIHCKENNVLFKKVSEFCTLKDNPKRNYIIMFILTYRTDIDLYRSNKTEYTTDNIKNLFVVNSLLEWAHCPKIIFYQTPSWFKNRNDNGTNSPDSTGDSEKAALPIEADIMEAFSCYGNQDSYGNEAGSFYIQALCTIFNRYIDEGTIWNKPISDLMYEVHAKVREFVNARHSDPGQVLGDQTPHVRSTLVKQFVFPK